MNETKPWYLSKTLWTNVVALAASLIVGLVDVGPEVQSEIVAGALAVANIVLRLITNKGVSVK